MTPRPFLSHNFGIFKAEKPRIPNDREIKDALEKIDWKKVIRKDNQVYLPVQGMGLDFGGFGKEYAVDRVLEMGLELGISDLLVNFGGDLRTVGSPPDSPHWRVGIEDPNQPGQARFTVGRCGRWLSPPLGIINDFSKSMENATDTYSIIVQVTQHPAIISPPRL